MLFRATVLKEVTYPVERDHIHADVKTDKRPTTVFESSRVYEKHKKGAFLGSEWVENPLKTTIVLPQELHVNSSSAAGGFAELVIDVPYRAIEILTAAVNETREYFNKPIDLTPEGQAKISDAFNAHKDAPVEFLKAAADAGVFNSGVDLTGLAPLHP